MICCDANATHADMETDIFTMVYDRGAVAAVRMLLCSFKTQTIVQETAHLRSTPPSTALIFKCFRRLCSQRVLSLRRV